MWSLASVTFGSFDAAYPVVHEENPTGESFGIALLSAINPTSHSAHSRAPSHLLTYSRSVTIPRSSQKGHDTDSKPGSYLPTPQNLHMGSYNGRWS